MSTDPDGGLVMPERLLLTEPAEEALLDGIPEGCPRPDLWGKREVAEGMDDTAGGMAFFTEAGGGVRPGGFLTSPNLPLVGIRAACSWQNLMCLSAAPWLNLRSQNGHWT